MPKRLTLAGKHFRDKAMACLRRVVPVNSEDALNNLIADPLADLVKAANAQGFTREEIRKAIYRGAFNGWAEVREDAIGSIEAEGEGVRFARSLGQDNGAFYAG